MKLYKNYKPFGFFTWIAALLTVMATAFLIPVLCDYATTGLVLRFPTLIVCCFVYLSAIQAFFAGLMLSTIRQKNLQDYETKLVYLQNMYKKSINSSL